MRPTSLNGRAVYRGRRTIRHTSFILKRPLPEGRSEGWGPWISPSEGTSLEP